MNVRWIGSRVLWGGLLVAGGILFLLQNLGVIHFADVVWAVVFAIVAIFALSFFFADQNNWWALIPAGVLTTLAFVTVAAAPSKQKCRSVNREHG